MRASSRLFIISIPLITLFAAYSSASAARSLSPAASGSYIPVAAASTPTPAPTPIPGQLTQISISAKLSELNGNVLAREAQDTGFSPASVGKVLQVLGQVQTKSDGKVRLDFSTGTLLRLGPGTLFTLDAPQPKSNGLLNRIQLSLGKFWIILRGGSLEVNTPAGVAAVKGSLMSVHFDPATGKVKVTCLEGHCSLTNPAGTVNITTGQTAQSGGEKDPPKVGQMTEQDYADWLANMPEAACFVPGVEGCSGIKHEKYPPSEPQPQEKDSPKDTPPKDTPPKEPPDLKCGGGNCGVGHGGGGGNGTGNEGRH